MIIDDKPAERKNFSYSIPENSTREDVVPKGLLGVIMMFFNLFMSLFKSISGASINRPWERLVHILSLVLITLIIIQTVHPFKLGKLMLTGFIPLYMACAYLCLKFETWRLI